MRGLLVWSCVLAGCSTDPAASVDPCEVPGPVLASGAAEIGLGRAFTPIVDGEDVIALRGIQGSWMVVLNVRVSDLDVGTDLAGAVLFTAVDENGATVSLATGCRALDFQPTDTGDSVLAYPYALLFAPSFWPRIEGAQLTLVVDVRDHNDRRVSDHRSITMRMPAEPPGPLADRPGPSAGGR
jgi:hypothetical protein